MQVKKNERNPPDKLPTLANQQSRIANANLRIFANTNPNNQYAQKKILSSQTNI
jgi:hypothetical protein